MNDVAAFYLHTGCAAISHLYLFYRGICPNFDALGPGKGCHCLGQGAHAAFYHPPGAIETSGTLCLEQIVVDEEIAKLCKRLRDGIDTSDEKDFYDDIKAVGPGGHFLMQPNTVKACRSEEFLMPLLSNRSAYESWVKLGSPDIYQEAQQKVEEILATPQKHPLPDDVIGKLEAIIRRAEEELESDFRLKIRISFLGLL
jgi:trimethylamine:corrinoid methyltransferase-like protein